MNELKFLHYDGDEYHSTCDRFAVVPTPDGWVALDFANKTVGRAPVMSDEFYRTPEEAQGWCRARLESELCDPSVVVGG